MFAATSLRKAVLNAAASSKVSGGTSRVLVLPGSEAFAITAMPQDAMLGGWFAGLMRGFPLTGIGAVLRERAMFAGVPPRVAGSAVTRSPIRAARAINQ